MIGGIHDAIFICIFPPAPTQVTRVTRAKLRGPRYDLLKATPERQRVFYHECIIVQTLTGDIYNTRDLITTSRGSRNSGQQRDDEHNKQQAYFSFHFLLLFVWIFSRRATRL